jgi:hypothetical protein
MKDEQAIWERSPNEPTRWYARFRMYLFQGPSRSLVAVYRTILEQQGADRRGKKPLHQVETVPHAWTLATKKYQWAERAAAFDQSERERKDREWETAREVEREAELLLAQAMRDKARQLLELPVLQESIKRDKDGAVIAYQLVPQFKAFAVAAQLCHEAMVHSRGALEMPSSYGRAEIVGKGGGPLEIHHSGEPPEARLEKLLALAEQAATAGSVGLEG